MQLERYFINIGLTSAEKVLKFLIEPVAKLWKSDAKGRIGFSSKIPGGCES